MRNRKMILTLVVLLVVGFASVSTTLFLNGVIGISGNEDDFKIIFTSAKLNNKKRNDFISEDKKSINFETDKLTTVDEEAYLDYEVTNTSRLYDGEVVISCIVPENDYVIVDYQPRSMTVNAGETENGRITARLLKASAEDDSISIECTLNATATERESLGDEYIEPFSRSGVLMAYKENTAFWGYRSNITKVVFENTMNEHKTNEDLIFDVSSAQDKSVMAYLVPNEDNAEMYTLYIQSESGVKANPNSSYLFANFNNLSEIENMKYLDTSDATNMNHMFYRCWSLPSADFSNFDTSKVKNMISMFEGSSFVTLDLSSFDTSHVTDFSSLFNECRSLISVDLSGFDTSSVTSMFYLFRQCSSIQELDLNNFDVSKVTTFQYAFEGCKQLTKIKFYNWHFNESNSNNIAVDMYAMFQGCGKLVDIDVSNWNMSNVGRTSLMFNECVSLKNLDVSKWDVSRLSNATNMFFNCSGLTSLDVSNWNVSQLTVATNMFWLCKSLEKLDVSNWDTSNITNMSGVFAYCENLEVLDVSNWNTSKVTDMSSAFGYLRKVSNLDVSKWDTSNVTTMRAMFVECNALVNLNLSNFDMSKVTNLNSFVAGCHNLVTTFTIRGTNCTNYAGETGYWPIFLNAATNGNIVVNYTADASDLVDQMIATKSEYSKVSKGNLVV